MLLKSIVITAAVSVALLSAAGHFDDVVRKDFFAGIAGDQTALQRAMAASEDAIANDPHFAAEAKSWHGTGLLVMSGQKFQQGDTAAGAELWARAIEEMDDAGQMNPTIPPCSFLVPPPGSPPRAFAKTLPRQSAPSSASPRCCVSPSTFRKNLSKDNTGGIYFSSEE